MNVSVLLARTISSLRAANFRLCRGRKFLAYAADAELMMDLARAAAGRAQLDEDRILLCQR